MEKFSAETKGSTDGSTLEGSKPREWFIHIQGLKGKILNQVKNLSMEAGGKGSAKKDLNSQRNTFRDILEFFEVHKDRYLSLFKFFYFYVFFFLVSSDYLFCNVSMVIVLKLQ